MPLSVYILGRLDLLGHDIGQVAAHAQSTCPTILFATSSTIWMGDFTSMLFNGKTVSRTKKNFRRNSTLIDDTKCRKWGDLG